MKPAMLTAFAGGFGGIAPPLLAIAGPLAATGKPPTVNLIGMLVGTLLLGLLGAGVASIYRERDLPKAFLLGVGLPSLISGVGLFASLNKQATNSGKATLESSPSSVLPIFTTLAFFQEPQVVETKPVDQPIAVCPPTQSLSAESFRLNRQLKLLPGKNLPPDTQILFKQDDGKVMSCRTLSAGAGTFLKIPDSASKIEFRAPSTRSLALSVPSVQDKTLNVGVEGSFWSGFLQAFGYQSNETGRITVETQPNKH